jgi:hypothetical protein
MMKAFRWVCILGLLGVAVANVVLAKRELENHDRAVSNSASRYKALREFESSAFSHQEPASYNLMEWARWSEKATVEGSLASQKPNWEVFALNAFCASCAALLFATQRFHRRSQEA